MQVETTADHQEGQGRVRLCVVSLDHLRRAIRDPALDRGHLKVLAHLCERFNTTTLTAWPSREHIGEAEGLEPKTVGNKLYELRARGYIDWGRMPDPKRPTRTLVNYWLTEEVVTVAVQALRERLRAESARPAGQGERPPGRVESESARPTRLVCALPGGLESALPSGRKELGKEGTRRAEARARVSRADRDIPSPHMNGVGYVVSENHGLFIPTAKVDEWRQRFSDLPDLEAAMSKLGTTVLARGRAHPGWTCLEGWMAGPLAEMNAEASERRRLHEAKLARAGRSNSGSATL